MENRNFFELMTGPIVQAQEQTKSSIEKQIDRLSGNYQAGLLSEGEYVRKLIRLHAVKKEIDGIHSMMAMPGSEALTSNQMRSREDQRKHIATSIKLNGGRVSDPYK